MEVKTCLHGTDIKRKECNKDVLLKRQESTNASIEVAVRIESKDVSV
jgi:hypothetical protein